MERNGRELALPCVSTPSDYLVPSTTADKKPEDRNSPAQFVENVGRWRSQIPDLSIDVFDDIAKKHRHKTLNVAVRFVMSGTLPGNAPGSRFEFEGAAFVKVVEGRATEWRLIVDSQVVEDLIVSLTAENDE